MRKYYRLVLLSVTVLSFISMFIYKYRYHNLQAIIDVMNFFPAKSPKSLECPRKLNYNMTSETVFSSNHWSELFDGIYVYSPHVLKSYVFFLAYSKHDSTADLKKLTCHLWFENKEKSIESKLRIHYLNNNHTHFYFECLYTVDFALPNAVTFVKDDFSITVPIFHKQLYTGQYAACVNSSINNFSDVNKIIEFLVYHSHIGIKHFLIYYTTFSNSVREVLANVANECDIVIELLPWITPPHYEYNSLKPQAFMIDCIFHVSALNHSDFVFLLDLNKFVVLKETESIKRLVYDNSPFELLKMEEHMFCLEYPNDIIAQELNFSFNTLLKTKVSTHASQSINVLYDVKHLMMNINQIKNGFKTWFLAEKLQNYKVVKSSSANIHSYSECGSQNLSNISFVEDKKMWSFKQVLFDSCIYKLAMSVLGKAVT